MVFLLREPHASSVLHRGGLAIAVLSVSSAKQVLAFLVQPTTPFATVASIGAHFEKLGRELGLGEPVLAHHDAGGTSYASRIRLLDLGGLGNRTIAKHRRDGAFLRRYILDEVRPDSVFGVANNFAAGTSRFWATPEFADRYLPIEFPNASEMHSDLCHVRRSLVEKTPLPANLHLVRDAGSVVKVVVN